MLHLPAFPLINPRHYFCQYILVPFLKQLYSGRHGAEIVMAVYPASSISKCGLDSGDVTCRGWVGSYFLHTSPQTPFISLSISHDLVSPGISKLSVFGSNMTAALVLFLGAQSRMEPGDQMLAGALITSCWLSCCWLFDLMWETPITNLYKEKNTGYFFFYISACKLQCL